MTGRQESKETGVSDSCFISELPMNVSHEIFFKLPIKAVMRCKCVCKAWNNHISNPNFSNNYAKNSSFTSIFHSTCLTRQSHILDLLEISEKGVCKRTPLNLNLPGWYEKHCVSCVGTCNGFFCMLIYKPEAEFFYVASPVMGVSIELPECERIPNGEGGHYMFGFSPSINKFKVLRIAFECSIASSLEKCEIITVGVDDMWRCLPITSFTGFFYFTDFLAHNGAFHWFRNDRTGLISTFNLTDESFGQISTPPSLLPNYEHVKLVALGDQLGLADSSAVSGISIWKMKEYAVVESWTKVVVLTISPPREPGLIHPIPLAELPNGDVLVLFPTGCLLSYSIKHKEWSEIRDSNVEILTSGYILNYTPNFSSHSEFITKGHQNAANVSQSSSQ